MALSSGARLGPYEVLSRLGEGGMGEVHLARDTRLDRLVAVKCVKDSLAHEPDRRARVEREAKIVAQLSHPHICTLHDIVHEGEQTFLVMEALEGETLAARLLRLAGKGLPVSECVTIAAEVAEGLAFAHQHGVVHQDVKPSNVMLTRTGAKLLDFGVARLRSVGQQPGVARTETADELVHAGTLPYMAPEQLDGRAETRSDIFALGAVLYEMLTGTRAFSGTSASTIIAQIVDYQRPALSVHVVPPALARLVQKCLAKEVEQRWQTATDLADELRWIESNSDSPSLPEQSARGSRRPFILVTAAALVAAVLAGAVGWRVGTSFSSSVASSSEPLRTDLSLPPDLRLALNSPPALSRDGRFLAFVAAHEGATRVYVRDLETAEVRALPGTDNAVAPNAPFWSPDGLWLAFFADGQLKRTPRSGGSPQTIAAAGTHPAGGDWNQDDVILFTPDYYDGTLFRVQATGGSPQPVLRPNRSLHEQSLTWPRFLPDGRAFLYVRDSGRRDQDGLMMRSLDRDDAVALPGIASAALAVPGALLYVRNGWIVAQPFDAARRALLGSPTAVAGPVEIFDSLGAAFAASSLERIVYRPLAAAPSLQLAWYARDGRVLEEIGRPEPGLASVSLSRDGRQLVGHSLADQTDLWLWDLTRGTRTRLTTTDQWETAPVMSSDGQQMVYGSDDTGVMDLYASPVARSKDRRLLASLSDSPLWPSDWSADGRAIVGTGLGALTQQDVWIYSVDARAVTWLARTPARESAARLSPTGRWFAYQSDESGKFEVYVAALASSGERWRVSAGGGVQPRWRGDGRELFYLGPAGVVNSVAIEEVAASVLPGSPARLFAVTGMNVSGWSRYGVSPDGQRFLIAREVSSPTTEGHAMVVGWRFPALPR